MSSAARLGATCHAATPPGTQGPRRVFAWKEQEERPRIPTQHARLAHSTRLTVVEAALSVLAALHPRAPEQAGHLVCQLGAAGGGIFQLVALRREAWKKGVEVGEDIFREAVESQDGGRSSTASCWWQAHMRSGTRPAHSEHTPAHRSSRKSALGGERRSLWAPPPAQQAAGRAGWSHRSSQSRCHGKGSMSAGRSSDGCSSTTAWHIRSFASA